METFFQDALSFLLLYKYAALFLITFLAAFALPLPSTTSLMTAAGFASQGYMSITLVIFFATLGNVVADNLAYWAARSWGTSVFERIGFKLTGSPVLSFITRRLQKHTRAIIFWSRFEVIMTITVNVLNGLAKSDYRQFFIYGVAGEAAQVVVFSGIGYFFGSSLVGAVDSFGELAPFLIAFVIVMLILLRKRLGAYFLAREEERKEEA